ncbi:MAG: hypothetical protein LZF62_50144 [Nitrospira sp.]|nr:MAG: hypothetical protein LZF62_50144 [Nitrospira sp.]
MGRSSRIRTVAIDVKSCPLSGATVPQANFSEKWKNGKIFRETCRTRSEEREALAR